MSLNNSSVKTHYLNNKEKLRLLYYQDNSSMMLARDAPASFLLGKGNIFTFTSLNQNFALSLHLK
jgi:hypothetical protein